MCEDSYEDEFIEDEDDETQTDYEFDYAVFEQRPIKYPPAVKGPELSERLTFYKSMLKERRSYKRLVQIFAPHVVGRDGTLKKRVFSLRVGENLLGFVPVAAQHHVPTTPIEYMGRIMHYRGSASYEITTHLYAKDEKDLRRKCQILQTYSIPTDAIGNGRALLIGDKEFYVTSIDWKFEGTGIGHVEVVFTRTTDYLEGLHTDLRQLENRRKEKFAKHATLSRS